MSPGWPLGCLPAWGSSLFSILLRSTHRFAIGFPNTSQRALLPTGIHLNGTKVAPVHSQPTPRNKLPRSRNLPGHTTLKGFTGTTGRGGRKTLLPGGYIGPDLRNALRRAKSEVAARDIASSTRTKYAGSYTFWVEFCRACDASPLLTGKHPQDDAELITDYVIYEYAGHGNKHGTIKQKLAAIRYFNIDLGYGNPREDCPSLDRIMKGIRRECGAVNRNLPVTSEMLTHIADRADLSHLRTRAVVTGTVTAFMLLLRCSEYASEGDATMGKHVIKRYHVVFKRKGIVTANPLIADQVEMAIPSSKTDQLGQGHTRTHYRTEGALCPVRLLAEWVNSTSEMPSGGCLFSCVNPDSTGHDTQNVTRAHHGVTKVLKAAATDLAYPASGVSTHSCRSGGATALIHAGVHPTAVQCMGRWCSDIYQIYCTFSAGLMVCRSSWKNSNVAVPAQATLDTSQ